MAGMLQEGRGATTGMGRDLHPVGTRTSRVPRAAGSEGEWAGATVGNRAWTVLGRFGATLALLALLAAVLPGQAAALHGVPHVSTDPENIDEAARLVEATGAYDVALTPASPGSVGTNAGWSAPAYEVIDDIPVTGGGQPGPVSAESDALHAELRRVGPSVGTLPKLAKFGRFALGGVAGFVGWEAGSFVLGEVFAPALPDANPGQSYRINGFRLLDKGDKQPLACGTAPPGPACESIAGGNRYTASAPTRLFEQDTAVDFAYCGNGVWGLPRLQPPAGASVVSTYFEPTTVGVCGDSGFHHYVIVDPIAPGEFSPPHNPIGPVEGGSRVGTQTASPCGTDWVCPTSAELNTKVADALNSGSFPTLAAWADHQAEPENYPDPTVTEEEEDHRCDRASGPTYMNPRPHPDPFAKHIETPFTVTSRPPGYEGADVFLHEGETHWIPGRHPETEPKYVDDWGGWGYRHILAKHGWSEQDRTETQIALSEPQTPTPTTGGWRYTKIVPTPGEEGVNCRRVVVVDFELGEGDPAPRGIVTSYNEVVG